MAFNGGGIGVQVTATPLRSGRTSFSDIRDKFERMSSVSGGSDFTKGLLKAPDYATLGRRPVRCESFSYGTNDRDLRTSPVTARITREQRERHSARTVRESGYDSLTLDMHPRSIRRSGKSEAAVTKTEEKDVQQILNELRLLTNSPTLPLTPRTPSLSPLALFHSTPSLDCVSRRKMFVFCHCSVASINHYTCLLSTFLHVVDGRVLQHFT